MLVNQVLSKYHKIVPFPWNLPKILKAGHDPTEFFRELGAELKECEDVGDKDVREILEDINKL